MATSDPTSELIEKAVELWSRSQVVFEVAAWRGEPKEAAMVELIADSGSACEAELLRVLDHENQRVVAYALLALKRIKSSALQTLPDSLLGRREKITLQSGGFSQSMDLGGLARQLKKRSLSQS